MSRAEMQAQTEVDWKTVVEQIQAGDAAGEEALYRNLVNGARLFLRRRLGTQDVEDRVHDLFIIVVETIRRGELREPERLMGFVRTVRHRLLDRQIAHIIASRETSSDVAEAENIRGNYPSPEDSVI